MPNTRIEMDRMLHAKASHLEPIYEIPTGMLKQTISRAQLQRLMDEDDSLPLLLGETKAVKVIHRFRKKAPDEDEEEDEINIKAGNPFMHTQADVFHRIDELERVPPEIELPKIPQIVGMTEDM